MSAHGPPSLPALSERAFAVRSGDGTGLPPRAHDPRAGASTACSSLRLRRTSASSPPPLARIPLVHVPPAVGKSDHHPTHRS